MNRLGLCRSILLIAVVLGMLSLVFFSEPNAIFFASNTAVNVKLQPNFQFDLARQNSAFPGGFMLAANLVPVVNYFCDALKPVNFSGGTVQDYKVIGTALQLHLVSLVIQMFYLFFRNRSTEEDLGRLGLGFKHSKLRCVVH